MVNYQMTKIKSSAAKMEVVTPDSIPPAHGSPLHRVFCCIMPAVQANAAVTAAGHKPSLIAQKPPKAPKPSKIPCGAASLLKPSKLPTPPHRTTPSLTTTVVTSSTAPLPPTTTTTTTTTTTDDDEDSLSLQKLLQSLSDLHQPKGTENDLDLNFVKEFLESADFQTLAKVHDSVSTPVRGDVKPLCDNAVTVLGRVTADIEQLSVSAPVEAQELLCILNYPHFEALLSAHDRIASKSYHPVLPDIPYEVDEDDEATVKIVRLIKGPNEPLGATIQMNEGGAIKVARILLGGAADRSGLIQAGDEVHEVNGTQVTGKPPDEVVRILTNAIGPVTLKLVPGDVDLAFCSESKMRVRAHFSYDSCDDKFIPCPEVGLSFQKGEILHIVSQDDPLWWQARKEGDRIMAGLIPGRQLAERSSDCIANKENKDIKEIKNLKTSKFSPKLSKKTKKTKRIQYHTQPDTESECPITYEEVERLFPRGGGLYRPIVLVGAPGVGRTELRRRLINSSITHFKHTIPYTTRHKKAWEIEGDEYHFVSKADFEKDVSSKKFLECGEFKGHQYGISLDQITSIINAGQVCIMCPQPQSIRILRRPEYKPFVIFIKPPQYERLKETRCTMKSKFTQDEKNPRNFTDEELKEMVTTSTRIESTYTHLFDLVIVNEDLQKATNELVLASHRLETEPYWVPALWAR